MTKMRFLIETTTRDMGHVSSRLSTLETDCPALEAILQDSYGGGPDNDDFVYVKLLGVESKPPIRRG
jgi:hypothetical protein